MPETMNKKAYQRYTQEFKDKAVGLLNLGKPVAEVARELEVSTSMLYEWRHKAQGTQGEQSEADALRALLRQVAA
jgi:transposase-like protein